MNKHKSIILLVFAFLILNEPAWSRTIPKSSQSSKEVKQLIDILRNQRLQQVSPDKVVDAIKKVGRLKAVEAIDDLVKLITFNPVAEEEKVIGIVTERSARYPAIDALFLIGKPSLPALIKVLEVRNREERTSINAVRTIASIFRGELPLAVKYLRNAASKSQSAQASKRLMSASEELNKISQGVPK